MILCLWMWSVLRGGPVKCMVSCTPRPPSADHVQVLDAALRTLGSQDGGDYFAGGQYTLADIAASTRIYRPIVLVEDHFGMDVQRLINEHRLDRWAMRLGKGSCGSCLSAAPL